MLILFVSKLQALNKVEVEELVKVKVKVKVMKGVEVLKVSLQD